MVISICRPYPDIQVIVIRATVKYHVSSILSKMGAASRTEAVALAIQRNMITVPTA